MRYFTNPKFYAMMTLEERKKYEEITEAIEILNVLIRAYIGTYFVSLLYDSKRW
jgi:hypothetical protein